MDCEKKEVAHDLTKCVHHGHDLREDGKAKTRYVRL